MVAGDQAITLRRLAAVTIILPAEEVTTHLRELTNLRLLPTQCRLFRRMVAVAGMVVGDVKSFASNRVRLCWTTFRLAL
jgi:hypothetical protein